MSEQCPACGSVEVYNSGFTIECATRDCPNYSVKQDLACCIEMTKELRKEYTAIQGGSAVHLESLRRCLQDAKEAAARTGGATSSDFSRTLQDIRFFNSRASILIGVIHSENEEERENAEEPEGLDEPDHLIDDIPFRSSTWMQEIDDVIHNVAQSMGVPPEYVNVGNRTVPKETLQEQYQKCKDVVSLPPDVRTSLEQYPYSGLLKAWDDLSAAIKREKKKKREEETVARTKTVLELFSRNYGMGSSSVLEDLAEGIARSSAGLSDSYIGTVEGAMNSRGDVKDDRHRKSTLSHRTFKGEKYTTGPVQYLGTIKQRKLEPLRRKKLGPGRYSARLYPESELTRGKPNLNGDVFPATTHDAVTFQVTAKDKTWKGVLADMSDGISEELFDESFYTFQVPMKANPSFSTAWPHLFSYVSDKTKMEYVGCDDNDSPGECLACALGDTPVTRDETTVMSSEKWENLKKAVGTPDTEEKVDLGQSSKRWSSILSLDPKRATSIVSVRPAGSPIGSGGRLSMGCTIKHERKKK